MVFENSVSRQRAARFEKCMVLSGVRKMGIWREVMVSASVELILDPWVMTMHGMPVSQMASILSWRVSGSRAFRYDSSEFPIIWMRAKAKLMRYPVMASPGLFVDGSVILRFRSVSDVLAFWNSCSSSFSPYFW